MPKQWRATLALDGAVDTASNDRGGLRIWCQTTPPDDQYAQCATGWCPTCKMPRTQVDSGFLMGAMVVVLHDESGQPFEHAVGEGAQLFSQHLCCAECGTTLTAPPRARRRGRKKKGETA